MKAYFKRLRTETNWFRLFIPIFAIMTTALVILLPGIEYIHEVVIRHKDFAGENVGFAVCVSLIFSAVAAGVISSKHIKERSDNKKHIS